MCKHNYNPTNKIFPPKPKKHIHKFTYNYTTYNKNGYGSDSGNLVFSFITCVSQMTICLSFVLMCVEN